MKALTLRQPWPWALLKGGCDTLSWSDKTLQGYRGPLLIHSATRVLNDFELVAGLAGETMPGVDVPGDVTTAMGGFVGLVVVDSTHHSSACRGICSEWALEGGFHSRVTGAKPLPSRIPGFGQRGLFEPAPRVLQIVGA